MGPHQGQRAASLEWPAELHEGGDKWAEAPNPGHCLGPGPSSDQGLRSQAASLPGVGLSLTTCTKR